MLGFLSIATGGKADMPQVPSRSEPARGSAGASPHKALRSIAWALAALAAVGLILLVYKSISGDRYAAALQNKTQTAFQTNASTGYDFDVQGRPVSAVRLADTLPAELRRGDSLPIVFKLQDRKTKGKVGNEHGGVLVPKLTAGDCAVTAQDPALTKPTDSYSTAAFVWLWSVDNCKSAGWKAVLLVLTFTPRGDSTAKKNDSDPVPYRELAFVHVVDTVSAQDVLATAVACATALAAVAGAAAKYLFHGAS